jgi:orotate phosphoribosyltransferase
MPICQAKSTIGYLAKLGLTNIRFSGGEPTLYSELPRLVTECKRWGVKRIALSTNGTASIRDYKNLLDLGVNDFSISLDSGCCAVGEKMTGGVKDSWTKASETIRFLSRNTYVSIGVVFNELNCLDALKTIEYIDSLHPADIRVIPSAQYNQAIPQLVKLSDKILKKYPILNYRIQNFKLGKTFRGIGKTDCHKCYLVLDDVAVAGKYQFPCIIYLREQGYPISEMGPDYRVKRQEWFENTNTYENKICSKNCLDVCVNYNNKADYYARTTARNLV